MEDNKYYTPKIEEFHVGFEYEIYEDFDHLPERSWHPQVYGKNGANQENIDYISWGVINAKHVRVKYLDIEDCVNLGWGGLEEHSYRVYENNSWMGHFKKLTFGMTVWARTTKYEQMAILIQDADETIFRGVIKNKSELKRLMEQLGI